MDTSTDPAERLLNLVIALVNTSGRMTKEQIRTSVAGYRGAKAGDAFERMFERDKDLLRDLGVPIVTVDDSGYAEEIGYRIDTEAYALPPIELTPAEYAVLGMAAEVWQDRALQAETARALTKLRAASGRAIDGDAASLLAPRVREAGAAYGPVFEAVLHRRAVTFTYRAASTGAVGQRHVEPWRLAARGGGWYLIGLDRDREAVRAFRLSRIQGRVRASGPENAYTIPDEVDVDELLGTASRPDRTAILAVVPERAAALRARGRELGGAEADAHPLPAGCAGRDLVEVEFAALHRFAAEITGYGDAIVVLEPEDLRADVLARLHAAAAVAAVDPDTDTVTAGEEHDG